MPRPQVSVIKRQREQAKRERQQKKAEKKEQRKSDGGLDADDVENMVPLTGPAPIED